jgi:hypothetical protein
MPHCQGGKLCVHQTLRAETRSGKHSNRKIQKWHLTIDPTDTYSRPTRAQPDTSGSVWQGFGSRSANCALPGATESGKCNDCSRRSLRRGRVSVSARRCGGFRLPGQRRRLVRPEPLCHLAISFSDALINFSGMIVVADSGGQFIYSWGTGVATAAPTGVAEFLDIGITQSYVTQPGN